MLKYEFLEKIDDEYVYAYYPDGNKNAPGKVGVKESGEKRIIEESDEDFGKRYAHHALKSIDVTEKSGTIAWY